MERKSGGPTGLFTDETPRRAALTRVGAVGVALLGAPGLRSGAVAKGQDRKAQGKHQAGNAKRNGKKPGPTGPTGPTGPAGGGGVGTGSTGPTGPTGPAGPPQIITIVTRNGPAVNVEGNAGGFGDAQCQAGEVATGGGAMKFLPDVCAMVTSFDINDGTGWRIGYECFAAEQGGSFVPQVRCLSVT